MHLNRFQEELKRALSKTMHSYAEYAMTDQVFVNCPNLQCLEMLHLQDQKITAYVCSRNFRHLSRQPDQSERINWNSKHLSFISIQSVSIITSLNAVSPVNYVV